MRKPWLPVSQLPRMKAADFGKLSSGELLGYMCDGSQRIVTVERYADEDCTPDWYTACSERWLVTGRILYWHPLVAGPLGAPVQRRRIKMLPLDSWMIWHADEVTAEGRYQPMAPRFNRPGRYLEGADCWFELQDGRAFTYPQEDFLFALKMRDAERISERQAEALAAIVAQRLATAEQRAMLWAYRDMMAIRETGRSARKRMIVPTSSPRKA